MATITQNALTLLELSKRMHRGSYQSIAEVLTKTNEIFNDIPFVQANGDVLHKFVRRASLPTISRRELNAGVPISSSSVTEHTAGIVLFEAYSEIDERTLKLSGDKKATRNSEALSFVESMAQDMATEIFYGSKLTSAGGFDGFATQLNTLGSSNGYVVANADVATASAYTSLYIVGWGPEKVFGIYPKGSDSAGMNHVDLGIETKTYTDSSSVNRMYRVWRDQFTMDGGLVIKDPRYVCRLCNIATGNLAWNYNSTSLDTVDPKKLILALNLMPTGNKVIYANKTLKYQLDVLAYDKANGFYTAQNIFGESVTMFRGVPIKLCEAIVNTEAEVVA